MTELQTPPLPAEVDLRGLPWMPVDTGRLLDSDLFALTTGEEFKAAVALWCKAWQQVPAASLPDDDRVLAHLSGAGARWKRVREQALRGFVKCSDGRLYHPVIAEKALEAWAHRQAQRNRAAKRWNKAEQPPAAQPAAPAAAHATASPTAMQGTGTGQGQDLFKTLEASPPAPGAAHPEPKKKAVRRIFFDFDTRKFTGITEADQLRWQDAHPAIAVPVEIDRAAVWMAANPSNRKSNWERFLVNWFGRAQERAARVAVMPQQMGGRR